MAVNQGLNVQLSADASQFISTLQAALAQAQAAASGMVDTASSMNAMASAANSANAAAAALNASLNAVTQSANNTSQSANAAANSAQNLGNSTLQASRGFGVFQNAITNGRSAQTILVTQARAGLLSFNGLSGSVTNAGQAIQSLRRPVTAGGMALTDFSRIAQDLPFGFIAIQNNIPPLIDSLGRLSAANGGAMGALRALGSALMGPAGIAFAVSSVTSLLTVVIQKYGSLGNAVDALLSSFKNVDKAQQLLNDTMAKGRDNADAELIKLKSLYSATQNINIPLKQRNEIIDDLQKKYPAYFGNLSNEAILAGKAEDAYKRLRDSIIAVAQSKAIEEELVNQAKAGRGLKRDYDDLVRSQLALYNQAGKVKEQIDALTASGVTSGSHLRRLRDEYGSLTAQAESYNTKLSDNRDKQAENATLSDRLAEENRKLAESFNEVTTGFDKQTKSGKSSQDVLKLLTSELAAIDYQAQLTGASFDSISKDKVAALQKAFESLVKLGLTPSSPVLKNIADQINLIGSATIGTDSIGKRLQEIGKAFVGPKIDPGQLINVSSNWTSLNTKLDALREGIKNNVSKLNEDINSIIQSTALEAGSALLGGVGEMLVKGSTNFVGSFLNIIAGGLDQLGKMLIIYSGVLKALNLSLQTLNPYVAAAAGAAAIVAAGAIRSYASKGLASFATGGFVAGGSQLAMIGDNPGREEYVIPSEVLDKLGGGGARIVRVVGVLRGQDIAFANQRANRAKARIN